MKQLLARHKKEQREAVAQITALKKQATKKNKRAILSQCADIQSSLNLRQEREIAEFMGNNGTLNSRVTSADNESSDEIIPEKLLASMNFVSSELPQPVTASSPQKPKKRNRAKERLAKRQEKLDAIRAEALSEAAVTPDYRAMEEETIGKLLENRGLTVHEVQPDGHCLFRSLSDQLALRHDIQVTVEELRRTAAQYIRGHRDDFIPYLFDEETMAVREVDDYTLELESTAMWGSDMEILALAKSYDSSVEVLTAGSAPITFNVEGSGPQLIVAFYKHSYGLGEHYNSCR
ncbi:cysteine proteinase [Metschnikowia bicuspidata]|uniref:Cysteine proteinase n=1 Tax=Metschnikowia bicuspidata TaxID=27322 RepID=A0A4P9ZCR3_9ASCO|nr:cysteine proteinase [Metschnikowia bicuspidata]